MKDTLIQANIIYKIDQNLQAHQHVSLKLKNKYENNDRCRKNTRLMLQHMSYPLCSSRMRMLQQILS